MCTGNHTETYGSDEQKECNNPTVMMLGTCVIWYLLYSDSVTPITDPSSTRVYTTVLLWYKLPVMGDADREIIKMSDGIDNHYCTIKIPILEFQI